MVKLPHWLTNNGPWSLQEIISMTVLSDNIQPIRSALINNLKGKVARLTVDCSDTIANVNEKVWVEGKEDIPP